MRVLMAFLAVLLLLLVSLQRTYSRYPLKELRRRARDGDEIAGALGRAVAYGHSLRAVLWGAIGAVSAVFFLLLSLNAPAWFALTTIAIFLWLGFVWLPAARISAVSERVAAYSAAPLEKFVGFVHPLIDLVVRTVQKHRPLRIHTGLYDRQDLIDLLATQQVTPGNRIEKLEIGIAAHALTFGDKTIGECMTPRRAVKMVSAQDALGPVVMDELHKSGHSRFPVYESKQDNIVGTLYLHDLVQLKGNVTAASVMRKKAYYLHEDRSLHDALQALLTTHNHLFIVVNSFEEFVGIISSEDVMEAIVGKPIMDEFDKYEDMRAVAARDAKQEHEEHEAQDVEPEEEPGEEQEVLEPEETDKTE